MEQYMVDGKKAINIMTNGYLFMLVSTVLAYMGSKVQLIDKIFMGFDWTGAPVFRYNPVMYCIGFFFYWGLLLLLYLNVFVKILKQTQELSVGWKVVSCALCFLQALVMYILLNYSMFQTGDYVVIEISVRSYLTVIGWPILTLIFPSINLLKKREKVWMKPNLNIRIKKYLEQYLSEILKEI